MARNNNTNNNNTASEGGGGGGGGGASVGLPTIYSENDTESETNYTGGSGTYGGNQSTLVPTYSFDNYSASKQLSQHHHSTRSGVNSLNELDEEEQVDSDEHENENYDGYPRDLHRPRYNPSNAAHDNFPSNSAFDRQSVTTGMSSLSETINRTGFVQSPHNFFFSRGNDHSPDTLDPIERKKQKRNLYIYFILICLLIISAITLVTYEIEHHNSIKNQSNSNGNNNNENSGDTDQFTSISSGIVPTPTISGPSLTSSMPVPTPVTTDIISTPTISSSSSNSPSVYNGDSTIQNNEESIPAPAPSPNDDIFSITSPISTSYAEDNKNEPTFSPTKESDRVEWHLLLEHNIDDYNEDEDTEQILLLNQKLLFSASMTSDGLLSAVLDRAGITIFKHREFEDDDTDENDDNVDDSATMNDGEIFTNTSSTNFTQTNNITDNNNNNTYNNSTSIFERKPRIQRGTTILKDKIPWDLEYMQEENNNTKSVHVHLHTDGKHFLVNQLYNNRDKGRLILYRRETSSSNWKAMGIPREYSFLPGYSRFGPMTAYAKDNQLRVVSNIKTLDEDEDADGGNVTKLSIGVYEQNNKQWNQVGKNTISEVIETPNMIQSIQKDFVDFLRNSFIKDIYESVSSLPIISDINAIFPLSSFFAESDDYEGENDYPLRNTNLFGASVAVSGDGNTVAISSPRFCSGRGKVQVYSYSNSTDTWTQKGQDLIGEQGESESEQTTKYSVLSMDDSGNRIAIGTPYIDSSVDGTMGSVDIYDWDSSGWLFNGKITRSSESDSFGKIISLSGDGRRIAVSSNGQVKRICLYQYKGNKNWAAIGANCIEENDGAHSISMSTDGTRMVVSSKEHARVYEYRTVLDLNN